MVLDKLFPKLLFLRRRDESNSGQRRIIRTELCQVLAIRLPVACLLHVPLSDTVLLVSICEHSCIQVLAKYTSTLCCTTPLDKWLCKNVMSCLGPQIYHLLRKHTGICMSRLVMYCDIIHDFSCSSQKRLIQNSLNRSTCLHVELSSKVSGCIYISILVQRRSEHSESLCHLDFCVCFASLLK